MRLWIEPAALEEIKHLPGNVRQQIRWLVKTLGAEPRPRDSRSLDTPSESSLPGLELRRLRLGNWRVVYVVDEAWEIVTVLAVRKRPPYDYSDLSELIADL
jgi:mRNA-degrading endonuclease RelE of RelBE toxin-antitoxin system